MAEERALFFAWLGVLSQRGVGEQSLEIVRGVLTLYPRRVPICIWNIIMNIIMIIIINIFHMIKISKMEYNNYDHDHHDHDNKNTPSRRI
jgi:L-asparagine transporter-like permease